MDFFFSPKAIALIGATTNTTKGGFSILKNLMMGFTGKIYPINPRYPEILGLRCYPKIYDVPDPVDIAIVFVPAALVPDVIMDCVRCGIKGVMIESGGFSETGEDGKKLQEILQRICRETGIRLWGPNCMGLVDAVNRNVFSFVAPSIWEYGITPGNVSLIVQSGMLSAGFLIDAMTHGTMGFSKVCSIGNKIDVEECELLEYLISDNNTKAIGLYLESIPEGRRFLETCSRSPKPVVVLKGGKSQKGAEAAMSHTASLAGNSAVICGALSQAGVVEATDFKQMIDMCRALAAFPDIKSDCSGRIAVLTFSGGAGIVSADFIERHGLEIAKLSENTIQKLKTVFPEWMPVSNPIDLWPAVEKNGGRITYQAAFDAVCSDPGVDAIFIHLFAGGFALNFDLSPIADSMKSSKKPVFMWLLGERELARKAQIIIQELGIPVYREIQRAVECIDVVFKRNKRDLPWNPFFHPAVTETVKKWNKTFTESPDCLDEHVSKQILSDFGIPVVTEIVADTSSQVKEFTANHGFPIVMKGMAKGVIHKSELGLVRKGIDSNDRIEKVLTQLNDLMPTDSKILVQKQIDGSIELIAGFVRDPHFGPCVMIGLGGIFAEAMEDAVFAVAPLSRKDALHLIERIKAQKVLNGFRKSLPLDREKLADILINLGQTGLCFPQIQEIDINPLIVSDGKPIAVDASIILRKTP